MIKKGIILAGGHGKRLYPITKGVSKQLLPIYDKPMIYYPLSVLMLAGIRDILIITKKEDSNQFKSLLGLGENLGIKISYMIQEKPYGIAHALLVGESFINNEGVCLILGDNIFWGQGLSAKLSKAVQNKEGATVFAYEVNNPKDFGVIEFDKEFKAISIKEKPGYPVSNYAVTGLYFYDKNVINIVKEIKPSKRGELEITDLNQAYIKNGNLNVNVLSRGFAWLDTGTHESLIEASQFVRTIENRQGYKIACIEEIALNKKWISKDEFIKFSNFECGSNYTNYLKKLIANF